MKLLFDQVRLAQPSQMPSAAASNLRSGGSTNPFQLRFPVSTAAPVASTTADSSAD